MCGVSTLFDTDVDIIELRGYSLSFIKKLKGCYMKKLILMISLFLLPLSSNAYNTYYEYQELIGYTVSIVSKVDGDFEGCDYGKTIVLQNGMTLKCNSYGYNYHYSPTVIVFAKSYNNFYSVKAIINDKIYDMAPIAK